MKAYFINLFNYDRYASELIVNVINASGQPAEPVKLMAHLLAAQQVWYRRCKSLPPFAGALWPDWQAGVFMQMIADNHHDWISFLNETDEAAFENHIAYNNLKGEPFSQKLSDILTHVTNHGTHHRAQAGQHLKMAGADLPVTDYIFYLRQLKS